VEFEGSNSLRGKTIPPGVVLYRFQGPFFFAAADKLEEALGRCERLLESQAAGPSATARS
jgi:MFS superfamily sulfate permease-like transporter